MPIRRRIVILLLIVAAFIASTIAITWVGLRATEDFVGEMADTQRRFQAIGDVERDVGTYAEQIAEVLLLGNEQMADFEAARRAVKESLAQLTALGEAPPPGGEPSDAELVRRVGDIHGALEASAARIFRLRAGGEVALALERFRTDVEYRLSDALKSLVSATREEAREDMTRVLDAARARQARLVAVAVLLSLVTSLACAGLGWMLYRNVVHPVRRLTRGAEAIAAGDLDHRVAIRGGDDFARLSDSFDAMAVALREKRDELTQAQRDLERIVALRTRELTRANDRLRRIDGQRAQFLADVSHELRTPLTILRGEADVGLRAGDETLHRDSLLRIRAQSEEMARLLEELLDFARSDSEDVPFDLEPVPLARVLGRAIADISVLAERAGVSLECREDEPAITVEADESRLKQVFLIGLDNAIKYSARGERILVSAARVGDRAEIVIADSGIGVPEGGGSRAFERFFRGADARGRSPDGLGLGLSIAGTIVARHGGEIALEGQEGRGAHLRIRLPVAGA